MDQETKSSIKFMALITAVLLTLVVIGIYSNQTYEKDGGQYEYVGVPISIDNTVMQLEIVWMDDDAVVHKSYMKHDMVTYRVGTERSIERHEVHGYNDFDKRIHTYDEWVITAELQFFENVL